MRIGITTKGDTDTAFDMARALDKMGMKVFLYLSYEHTASGVDTPERTEERLYELGLIPITVTVRLFKMPRMRDPRSLWAAYQISRSMRRDGVEVVNILMGPAEPWLVAIGWFLVGIPLVATIIIPLANNGQPYHLWVIPLNWLLTIRSDMVIVNGASQVPLMEKLYRISKKCLAHVPLNPRTTAVKWSIRQRPEEAGTVLFFGRIDPHKGLEFLVKSQPLISQYVPHARFIIAGHGDDLQRCLPMIRDVDKFEICESYFSGDERSIFFQRASIVVLPYISASTSGVLLDAYSFGKPVIATRVGCLPEYVVDGVTGILIPPMDIEELANAIIKLLTDDDLRNRMGQNALDWVKVQEEQTTIQLLDVFKKAVSIHG